MNKVTFNFGLGVLVGGSFGLFGYFVDNWGASVGTILGGILWIVVGALDANCTKDVTEEQDGS